MGNHSLILRKSIISFFHINLDNGLWKSPDVLKTTKLYTGTMNKFLFILSTILVSTISCTKQNNNLPTVSTQAIDSVTSSSVITGGLVLDEGDAPVIERGVVWSTVQEPTIADYINREGDGLGSFVSVVTGLLDSTTYYLRAYATNSFGTAYGDELIFTTKKAPTLSDRLEGIWQLNEITMSGVWNLAGLGLTPVVGNDQSIASNSLFTMEQTPNSVNFLIDSQLDISAGGITAPYPWQQAGSGSWLAKSGNNMFPDSLIITTNDGSIIRYEILSIIEDLSLLRLRTATTISNKPMTAELLLYKQ